MHGRSHARGLHQPRLYDFLLLLMTKGREGLYREQLLDLAALRPGERVLDIGCGTGTTAIAAAKRGAAAVSGIDVSEKMVVAARRKALRSGLASLDFQVSDALVLPYHDAVFDVVFLTTVLHMIPTAERESALREASRVLRAGGRLLAVDYGGSQRHGLVAKHHLHRTFDLESLRPFLATLGEVGGGSVDWLSLRYLLLQKA